MKNSTFIIAWIFCWSFSTVNGQLLKEFNHQGTFRPMEQTVQHNIQFNGYTNYWHDQYRTWHRYGNLFKLSVPNVAFTIAQSKRDVAEDMGLPGLTMQEGFVNELLNVPYKVLEQPSSQQLEKTLIGNNALVLLDPNTELGKMLLEKLPDSNWPTQLKSHQSNATDFNPSQAFYLENGDRKLFVVASTSSKDRSKFKKLILDTDDLLKQYDLHRGWFGAKSLLKSVTCMYGHPLETIAKGMNEGNTWFTFSGYMDFLMQEELATWLEKVGHPVVADLGIYNLYGCKDYDDLQIQDMHGKEPWIEFAKKKEGYIFRPVYDKESDPYQFDGYMATEGNKTQVDTEEVPFVCETGSLQNGAEACMMLFIKKGQSLSKELMWEAIMNRREVAVMAGGKMMGPASFRNPLQMLLLDRVYLEEYFGDRINMETTVDGHVLTVTLTNTYNHQVSGNLALKLPPELALDGAFASTVNLPAKSIKNIKIKISPTAKAMGEANPIAVHFSWGNNEKSTLALMDLPRAISVHQLLYGHAPKVDFPVSIHNFTNQSSFPVNIQVVEKDQTETIVFETSKDCSISPATFKDFSFNLELSPGAYLVKVQALGVENVSQLGVGLPEGKPYVYEDDLNSDGIPEFRMENDSVQITLLTTGARVIEYIIKSREDNVLFKLWPEKPDDHRRPFRERGFYPFGGFEDFLGQASMETHKVYDAEIIQKEGDYVRVKMTADYFGNILEKTFTLYGNSPLLEVRFALTFRNPEANVLGPQPILALGKDHWTEDVFIVPDQKGLTEFRMRPEEYYGQVIHLKEGWNAGYDTKEQISFLGAFPVTEPLFLHMWMNHPVNNDSHYYYAEFQPWVPIYQKSTMYFSYYMWASGQHWKDGLKSLERRNLISER